MKEKKRNVEKKLKESSEFFIQLKLN